jgi:hypothetical protein
MEVKTVAAARASQTSMFERHFSTRTLAELWGFSEDTIVRWFEDEPTVLKCGSEGGRGKRRKIVLRIPESTAMRVYQERCN